MSLFRRKRNEFHELKNALRHDRPEPRGAFLDEMVGKISPVPAVTPKRQRLRLGLALAFAVTTLAAFGALGGFGHAEEASTETAGSTADAISNLLSVAPDPNSTAASSGPATTGVTTSQSSSGASETNGPGMVSAASSTPGTSASESNSTSDASETAASDSTAAMNGSPTRVAASRSAATLQYGETVVICHVPPAGPDVTLTVSVNAVNAHLAHGDTLGPCSG